MSEPTYRVDLSHNRHNPPASEWCATIVRLRDEAILADRHGASREEAFAYALHWVEAESRQPEKPSSVYLSEDGDLLDPHKVQR